MQLAKVQRRPRSERRGQPAAGAGQAPGARRQRLRGGAGPGGARCGGMEAPTAPPQWTPRARMPRGRGGGWDGRALIGQGRAPTRGGGAVGSVRRLRSAWGHESGQRAAAGHGGAGARASAAADLQRCCSDQGAGAHGVTLSCPAHERTRRGAGGAIGANRRARCAKAKPLAVFYTNPVMLESRADGCWVLCWCGCIQTNSVPWAHDRCARTRRRGARALAREGWRAGGLCVWVEGGVLILAVGARGRAGACVAWPRGRVGGRAEGRGGGLGALAASYEGGNGGGLLARERSWGNQVGIAILAVTGTLGGCCGCASLMVWRRLVGGWMGGVRWRTRAGGRRAGCPAAREG